MTSGRAIVIVGAPRSGTSLLHKILRESPGTISVPHESSIIWNKVIHPENNNWNFEGAILSNLSNQDKELLRQDFQDMAMSNKKWQLWNQFGIMKYQWLAKTIRWVFPYIFPLVSKILISKNTKSRLIEKTVHGGLWMELIDDILEKPIFIHITRDGLQTIKSITNSWGNSERFGCYQVPRKISYQNKAFTHTWCFPLIHNWQKVCDRPLFEIATFQWLEIQKNILKYTNENVQASRYIRIKLEDLIDNPDCLLDLVNDLGLAKSDYFETISNNIPIVNDSKLPSVTLDSKEEKWINKEIEEVKRQLGY